MLEVAGGVHYIHSEGIVHGDLHGVSTLISYVSNQFIPLPTRGTFCLTLISTVKLPILGQLDTSRQLSLEPQQLFL